MLHSASWNGSIPLVKYLMNVHKSDPRYVRKVCKLLFLTITVYQELNARIIDLSK